MLRKLVKMIAHLGRDIIGKYELDKLFSKDKEIDEGYSNFINEIYSETFSKGYNSSYEALKKITKDFAEFPSIAGWNKYAQEHHYLNHIAMEYLVNLNWNKIKIMVEDELQKEEQKEIKI